MQGPLWGNIPHPVLQSGSRVVWGQAPVHVFCHMCIWCRKHCWVQWQMSTSAPSHGLCHAPLNPGLLLACSSLSKSRFNPCLCHAIIAILIGCFCEYTE